MAYFTVSQAVKEAANETNPSVSDKFPQNERTESTYMSEFLNILHQKLFSQGISYQRNKTFKNRGKGKPIEPDIWINGVAFIEVKSDSGDSERLKNRMAKFKDITEVPGILATFSDEGVTEIYEI